MLCHLTKWSAVWMMSIALTAFPSCSASEEKKGDEPQEDGANNNTTSDSDKSDRVAHPKVVIGGKTLELEANVLLDYSCNQFFVNFWHSQNTTACHAVAVNIQFETNGIYWDIKSPDNAIDIRLDEVSEKEDVTLNGTTLHCYLYSGDTFNGLGEKNYFGGTLFFAKEVVRTSSDLTSDNVHAIGTNKDVCAALY